MKPRRTIVITGSNTGIGASCAVQLARPGVHLVLACRSEEKAQPVLEVVRQKGATAAFAKLDLGSLAASSAAGAELAASCESIDLLVNNAGLGGHHGTTRDGFEIQFGTNHLGHFAFTMPLLARVERANGRIVNVSSGNHRKAKGIPWERLTEPTRSLTGMGEYGVSKLCNVLFTAELRRRHASIEAVSMNPGRIASDIWRKIPQPLRAIFPMLLAMKPVDVGGAYLVHACEAPLEGPEAPLYFDKGVAVPVNPLALREDLASELWEYSLKAVAAASPDRPAPRRTTPVALEAAG
ncbi:MAG: SDR family NAD(P)-dependent oxidoreductase [Deltaproteobacteria bacterium]|nr:SDR family NAD(P)-dependent oxidoreductase [Deltaproteobacteria bacterium]